MRILRPLLANGCRLCECCWKRAGEPRCSNSSLGNTLNVFQGADSWCRTNSAKPGETLGSELVALLCNHRCTSDVSWQHSLHPGQRLLRCFSSLESRSGFLSHMAKLRNGRGWANAAKPWVSLRLELHPPSCNCCSLNEGCQESRGDPRRSRAFDGWSGNMSKSIMRVLRSLLANGRSLCKCRWQCTREPWCSNSSLGNLLNMSQGGDGRSWTSSEKPRQSLGLELGSLLRSHSRVSNGSWQHSHHPGFGFWRHQSPLECRGGRLIHVAKL